MRPSERPRPKQTRPTTATTQWATPGGFGASTTWIEGVCSWIVGVPAGRCWLTWVGPTAAPAGTTEGSDGGGCEASVCSGREEGADSAEIADTGADRMPDASTPPGYCGDGGAGCTPGGYGVESAG